MKWAELNAQWEALDSAPYWAVEGARRMTALSRHTERAEATYSAALSGVPDAWRAFSCHIAALRLAADAVGIGGPGGLGSLLCRAPWAGAAAPSTERHPAFRGLGSGRRHARDGGAWRSAARDVAENYLPHLEGIRWGEDGVAVFRFEGDVEVAPEPEVIGGGDDWFRAAVYAALKASYRRLPLPHEGRPGASREYSTVTEPYTAVEV